LIPLPATTFLLSSEMNSSHAAVRAAGSLMFQRLPELSLACGHKPAKSIWIDKWVGTDARLELGGFFF
jgi:hypothetical protein